MISWSLSEKLSEKFSLSNLSVLFFIWFPIEREVFEIDETLLLFFYETSFVFLLSLLAGVSIKKSLKSGSLFT